MRQLLLSSPVPVDVLLQLNNRTGFFPSNTNHITEAMSTENDDGHPHITGVGYFGASSTSTKAVYRISIANCTALWTKASRSTIASEQEVTQRKLLVPSSTRWSSFHEAVSRITEIPMNELNSLCSMLGVKCFNWEKE
ncbi:hypothetical protein DPX16_1004 [Anabarilius grahami]|uniref:Uncharacterized protein n=1 Tax=Anabarilius grahami TaxID=495550 RepID=A0A3N0XTD8_ANAGA|nr:hypothetical protein DPX16_1004 [Anabarilius grahami]